MRIGILTFHRAYNCGAMLQAWALKTVLERLGHQVSFPACNDVGYVHCGLHILNLPCGVRGFRRVRSALGRLCLDLLGRREGPVSGKFYNSFRNHNLPEMVCVAEEIPDHYDCVVVGSDQVLNPAIAGKYFKYFLCEAMPEAFPKIGYAISMGDRELNEDIQVEIDNALAKFLTVSVRESYKDFTVVVDPTLLLAASDYDRLISDRCGVGSAEYIYMYSCTMQDYELRLARQLAAMLGVRLIISPVYRNYQKSECPEAEDILYPEKLLAFIKGAKYVIAGSFHATVFALVYGKPVLSLYNGNCPTRSRQYNLLSSVGMSDRLITDEVDVEESCRRLVAPVSPGLKRDLDLLRKESFRWIQTALAEVGA